MKHQPPKNGKRYKAILKRLAAVGWIHTIAEIDETAERDPLLGIQFTEIGLANVSKFYGLHEGFWDMSDADRERFYELLWFACQDSRRRHGLIE